MKITIYGCGYVGLVTGACLAEVGHQVLCVDTDVEKVKRLKKGECPIYEPGLTKMLKKSIANENIKFTTNAKKAVAFSAVQIIAVGTPAKEDGSSDLKYVISVAKTIALYMEDQKFIISKSTVPVGTADLMTDEIRQILHERDNSTVFDVISNPEFLKEGNAIEDFMKADRIIIGTKSRESEVILREIYSPYCRKSDKLLFMSVRSSELTKYASNAMLATKISFMNEMATIADFYQADIEEIRVGMGSDSRIGNSFIYPGCGYGGSCFPKDLTSLINMGEDITDFEPHVVQAVDQRNIEQKKLLSNWLVQHFSGDLKDKKIAIWGLAFKPGTDDVREATSMTTVQKLLGLGAKVQVFDPIANDTFKQALTKNTSNISYFDNQYDCLDNAEALVIHTEWNIFRSPNFELMAKKIKHKVIFDGRNLFQPKDMTLKGWSYRCVGRSTKV